MILALGFLVESFCFGSRAKGWQPNNPVCLAELDNLSCAGRRAETVGNHEECYIQIQPEAIKTDIDNDAIVLVTKLAAEPQQMRRESSEHSENPTASLDSLEDASCHSQGPVSYEIHLDAQTVGLEPSRRIYS